MKNRRKERRRDERREGEGGLVLFLNWRSLLVLNDQLLLFS